MSKNVTIWGAALAIAGGLMFHSGSAVAQMRQDVLRDPEGAELALKLMPHYETLAHHRIFAMGEAESADEGRSITDLTRDDVCGCFYAEGGGVVNAEQCEPIRATGNDNLGRLGIMRVVQYDRLRRSVLPASEKSGDMAVASLLGRMGRGERFKIEAKMKLILSDPHLVVLAPLPVADRLMTVDIGRPDSGRQPWQSCDIVVGDTAFSPPAHLAGFVARALLYAASTYGIEVDFPLGTLKRVSDQNPATPWEIARNALIARYMRPYGPNALIPTPTGAPLTGRRP